MGTHRPKAAYPRHFRLGPRAGGRSILEADDTTVLEVARSGRLEFVSIFRLEDSHLDVAFIISTVLLSTVLTGHRVADENSHFQEEYALANGVTREDFKRHHDAVSLACPIIHGEGPIALDKSDWYSTSQPLLQRWRSCNRTEWNQTTI